MKKLVVKKISFEPEFRNPNHNRTTEQHQAWIRRKAKEWGLIPSKIPEFYRQDCVISLRTEHFYFEWDGKLFSLKRGETELTRGWIEITEGGDLRSFLCKDEDGWKFEVRCLPD